MFVVVCWLACFAAGRSAGSYCLMRTHSHVRSLFVPSSIRNVFLVCSQRPLPPSPISFLIVGGLVFPLTYLV